MIKNKNKIATNVEENAPKKVLVYGSKTTEGRYINGIKLLRIVIMAIVKLAVIRPSPYKINIKKLLLGSLVTPKL